MFKRLAIILGCIYTIVLAVYWFRIGGESTVIVRNSLYLFTPFIALCAGIFTLSQYGLTGPRARTVVLLTFGMGCWLVGEVLFYLYEFLWHINPFPSIADAFYILAYPLFLFSLVHEMRETAISWKKLHPAVLFLFVIAAVALGILVVYFGVYRVFDPQETLLTNSIAMGYGIGDLLLIIATMCILILAWEFRGGRLSRVWILLFSSFMLILVADILFAQFNMDYENEVWFAKSIIDSFFMGGYMLFALALADFGLSIVEARRAIERMKKPSPQ